MPRSLVNYLRFSAWVILVLAPIVLIAAVVQGAWDGAAFSLAVLVAVALWLRWLMKLDPQPDSTRRNR